jgi:hypothetical protein
MEQSPSGEADSRLDFQEILPLNKTRKPIALLTVPASLPYIQPDKFSPHPQVFFHFDRD